MISVYGGTGFVGSEYCRQNPNIVIIDRENNTPVDNTDVVYFISTTHNYNVFEQPFLDVETNLIKLISVLEEFKHKCPNNTFNFISSCFVYGDTVYPAREDTVCNPKGFYSITKLAAERMLISYCETFNLKYRILRLCSVYGEDATDVSKKRNALQYMVRQVINDEEVNLYDDGQNKRDFMHVKDVCKAIKLCVEKAEYNDIINIGSGEPQAFRPLIEYVKSKTNSGSQLKSIDPPHFHKVVQVKDIYFDVSKLKKLGFKQTISIHEGIDKIMETESWVK